MVLGHNYRGSGLVKMRFLLCVRMDLFCFCSFC